MKYILKTYNVLDVRRVRSVVANRNAEAENNIELNSSVYSSLPETSWSTGWLTLISPGNA